MLAFPCSPSRFKFSLTEIKYELLSCWKTPEGEMCGMQSCAFCPSSFWSSINHIDLVHSLFRVHLHWWSVYRTCRASITNNLFTVRVDTSTLLKSNQPAAVTDTNSTGIHGCCNRTLMKKYQFHLWLLLMIHEKSSPVTISSQSNKSGWNWDVLILDYSNSSASTSGDSLALVDSQ